jgi:hypothetical protein
MVVVDDDQAAAVAAQKNSQEDVPLGIRAGAVSEMLPSYAVVAYLFWLYKGMALSAEKATRPRTLR